MRARPPRHSIPWPAALAVLIVTGGIAGGCVSQEYVHDLGRQAARGAVIGVGEGLPAIEDPLRQALRRALVQDDTLREAARGMADEAVKSLEVGLASPELRRQLDALIDGAMARLGAGGGEVARGLARTAEPELRASMERLILAVEPELREALHRLIVTAEPQLKAAIQRAASESIDGAAARLRERIDTQVIPATERLARRTGEELISSLVAGLEGPLQERLVMAGQEMSKALIKGAAAGFNDPSNQGSFGGLSQMMMLHAMRGARQGVQEGLPDERQMTLIASIVVLAALLLLSAAALSLIWWRYHQSAKSLTIMAESINLHDADELRATIERSARENYVGPWLSSFLKRRGL